MNEKFFLGLVLGMMGGAVIVANSVKVRQLIKDGQKQVKQKVTDMTKDNKKSE